MVRSSDPGPDRDPILANIAAGYNATPQAELLGLSPNEAAELISGDWRTVGAFRLSPDLSAEQASRGWAFRAAPVLLGMIRDEGPVPVTATSRNLVRAFMARAVEAVGLPAEEYERIRSMRKVINETDVPWLARLREALTAAGWIHHRKGVRITPRGREALATWSAEPGRRYLELFMARVGADRRLIDHPGEPVHSVIGPAFYLLGRHAAEWAEFHNLTGRLILPTMTAEMTASERRTMGYQWVVAPGLEFGLVEEREGEMLDPTRFRVTPLYREFVSFRFRAAGAGPQGWARFN
ncbi:MAG: hypothetical protein R2882_15110 [Gemmatimonadales bacterium]